MSPGALWFAVVGLVSIGACGSRTSMLDADAYGTGDGGSSGRTPVGQAGKTSTGASPSGGVPSMPTGGASVGAVSSGAASSVDPTIAKTTCQQYCQNYGTQCKKKLKGQDCLTTCEGEINNFGPVCQLMGVEALRCLTPFFSPGGGNCDEAVGRALQRCGGATVSFDGCKKDFAASPSKPSSKVGACSRSTFDASSNCTEIFDCASGPFVTFCNSSPQTMQLSCSCISPTGTTSTAPISFSADPCLEAGKLCF